ncbi:MAG: hypothetical protein AABY22_21555 [Nanoarchaeota archaeon]
MFWNKSKIKHDWEIALVSHDSEEHKEYKMFRCKACGEYKKEYTGRTYGQNKCEFCDSVETIRYPAEGSGDVYLCEDCRSVGSGESKDR